MTKDIDIVLENLNNINPTTQIDTIVLNIFAHKN